MFDWCTVRVWLDQARIEIDPLEHRNTGDASDLALKIDLIGIGVRSRRKPSHGVAWWQPDRAINGGEIDTLDHRKTGH
ncbi:hypothetical protein [Pseudomonas glycinae]|uniref:Uncharacterized protein n=1 Tax=Pseudomonas glycinae TaxID=1785145 RepID=A0ABN5FMP9_9PSED|nr:hypothetical protein [Pseudomonas glycinae]AUG97404.1 hypothetical protein AWU82_28385 [Pseudomonas glycinae]